MTPTEQDKELRGKVAAIIEYWDFSPLQDEDSRIERLKNEIMQLITADRKRVALEAELELLTYLLDERTEHMFMQNPESGEMTGNGWLCNTSLSAVSANRIEAERRKRIAELKAQQEKV